MILGYFGTFCPTKNIILDARNAKALIKYMYIHMYVLYVHIYKICVCVHTQRGFSITFFTFDIFKSDE